MRGPCEGCADKKNPTIWGGMLGPLIFGNSHMKDGHIGFNIGTT